MAERLKPGSEFVKGALIGAAVGTAAYLSRQENRHKIVVSAHEKFEQVANEQNLATLSKVGDALDKVVFSRFAVTKPLVTPPDTDPIPGVMPLDVKKHFFLRMLGRLVIHSVKIDPEDREELEEFYEEVRSGKKGMGISKHLGDADHGMNVLGPKWNGLGSLAKSIYIWVGNKYRADPRKRFIQDTLNTQDVWQTDVEAITREDKIAKFDMTKELLRGMPRLMKRGHIPWFYPEGSRTESESVDASKISSGSAQSIRKADVVIPTYPVNSNRVWPKHGRPKILHLIQPKLKVGKRFYPQQLLASRPELVDADEQNEFLIAEMARRLNELKPTPDEQMTTKERLLSLAKGVKNRYFRRQ